MKMLKRIKLKGDDEFTLPMSFPSRFSSEGLPELIQQLFERDAVLITIIDKYGDILEFSLANQETES